MDFRYHLAKKTFKNKKIPQKRAPGMDVISQDQRGDDSSPEISPLSLDRQTITPKSRPPEEEKKMSRRDLFSFGNFMKSAAELDVKPIEETEEEKEERLGNSLKSDDTSEEPAVDLETDHPPSKKKGFFKRFISRFRSSSKTDEQEYLSTNTTENDLTVPEETSSSKITEKSNKTPEIIQCFTTTGNGSHVLLAVTKNTHTLEKLLRTIQGWPGVQRTETQMILSAYKSIKPLKL